MKLYKTCKSLAKTGGKIAGAIATVGFFFDHLIHRKEYARKKRRKTALLIILGIFIGTLVVLFFPYRFIVKKNGDFEIRCLLLRVYRNTEGKALPAGKASRAK